MTRILYPISISLAFLVANVVILRVILALNQRTGARPSQPAPPAQQTWEEGPLDPSNILEWEFEYARTTASEAMQHRFTTINFYLVALGIITSGVAAVLQPGSAFPKAAGIVLLWLLCGIGWLYFLELIRLRQAWHESARAMNQIKDFYIQHAKGFEPDVLRSAFRWKPETLPPPNQLWTALFYSTILIGFLDSVAYVAGGTLLVLDASGSSPSSVLGLLVLFGLAFFYFHVWLYSAFLRPRTYPA